MNDELPHPTIKHVVVLMLENRGFDHVMGWLYDKTDLPINLIPPDGGATCPFLGLSMLDDAEWDALYNPLPLAEAVKLAPRRGARSPKTPSYNPGESFPHIMNQLWGRAETSETWENKSSRDELIQSLKAERALELSAKGLSPETIARLAQDGNAMAPMTGYVLDYSKEIAHHTGKETIDTGTLSEIMETYVPEQLPVLSGLARFYAVSDDWYCSAPTQTNANRAFSLAGTSRGMVNNNFHEPSLRDPKVELMRWGQTFRTHGVNTVNPRSTEFLKKEGSHADQLPQGTRSLFEVLAESGFSWKVYWQSPWPPLGIKTYQYVQTMFTTLSKEDANFVQFDPNTRDNAFFEAARNNALPAVSWIEPRWGGGKSWDDSVRGVGNDLHPVSDTTVGEDFVAAVYHALTSSRSWLNTLLIITFDENGGTYDHRPPPGTLASGMDNSIGKPAQFAFDFQQLGARVPTLLISPRITKGTVFRSLTGSPFDHTSIIATILSLAGVDKDKWSLGARVLGAPTFEHVLETDQEKISNPDAVFNPEDALSVPVRTIEQLSAASSSASPQVAAASSSSSVSKAESLEYDVEYALAYVGSLWHKTQELRYLGADSKDPTTQMLTSVPENSTRIRLLPGVGNSSEERQLRNMDAVRIVRVDRPELVLTASWDRAWNGGKIMPGKYRTSVLYNTSGGPAAHWQIRILQSRNPKQRISIADHVFFVSLCPPPSNGGLALITPDPLRRLLQDPYVPDKLTTLAGEWALWKLVGVDRR